MIQKLIVCFFFFSFHVCLSQKSNNNFRNGTSPSTSRILFPDQVNNGYNHIIYQTEGLDGLNYYGNRLDDYDLDGKFDIMMRAKEYLDGSWDLPSWNPRVYLKGSITPNFKFTLENKDVILQDGQKIVYDSLNGSKYVFNFDYGDPAFIKNMGDFDFNLFYQKRGFVKHEDYAFDNAHLRFTPRLYEIKNGVIKDVTKSKLIFSDKLKKDILRFCWPQAISKGDIDGDGDIDVIISARNNFFEIENFTNNFKNFQSFIVFKNQGDGTLFADVFSTSNFGNYSIQEGNQLYAQNMDDDKELEILTSISFGDSFTASLSQDRVFGFLDFNFKNNTVSFNKIFNTKDYLEDSNWTIEPKDIKSLPNKSNRNLLLFIYGKQYGSPVKKISGETKFTEGAIQQYFRVYEFINKNLVNVTSDFFSNNENLTQSLDNSGQVYFIDVDGDGLVDIFPQLGHTPYPELGGIKQFLKYPAWNGKFNTMYYFKQDNFGKYKLTDWATIENFNFPQKFQLSDYNLFDDYGQYTINGETLRIEQFTALNNVSLHDVDNDGSLELFSSNQPDFLNVFTKSKIDYSPVSKYNIEESRILFSGNPNNEFISLYDFTKYKCPVDTAYLVLDNKFQQKFIVKDPSKLITMKPFLYKPKLSNLPHTIEPAIYFDPTVVSKIEHELTINYNSIPVPDSSGKRYVVPYVLPVQNDMYIKKVEMVLSKKNLPPLPFSILTESKIEDANFKGFELTFSNSVDINLNEYTLNGNIIRGLKYGYELYLNNVLSKTVILDQIPTNKYVYDSKNNTTTIIGFRIPIEGNTFSNTTYKVFALDTQNEIIKTNATIADADKDGVLDGMDNCPNSRPGAKVDSKGCELILANSLTDKKVIISPNPFDQSIKIEFPEDFGPFVHAKIHDIKGVVVWEKESVRDSEMVDLSSLSVGNYVLNLTSQTTGKVSVVKISKQGR